MFGVVFPVVVVSIFREVFATGTFLALGFSIHAFVIPFAATVGILLNASAVVLLLVTAVVFAFVIFEDAFAVLLLLVIFVIFVVFGVVIFVVLWVVCPFLSDGFLFIVDLAVVIVEGLVMASLLTGFVEFILVALFVTKSGTVLATSLFAAIAVAVEMVLVFGECPLADPFAVSCISLPPEIGKLRIN